MNADAHVEAIEVNFLAHLRDDLDHAEAQLGDVGALLFWLDAVIAVQEAHHHVAVADRIDLVELQLIALFVE